MSHWLTLKRFSCKKYFVKHYKALDVLNFEPLKLYVIIYIVLIKKRVIIIPVSFLNSSIYRKERHWRLVPHNFLFNFCNEFWLLRFN